MRPPRSKDAPVDDARFSNWREQFEGYRTIVRQPEIKKWLGQFAEADRDLAARLLDCVEFWKPHAIENSYARTLSRLKGWNPSKAKRTGRWFFVPFSSSPGESGDAMMSRFRVATRMAQPNFNSLFAYRSDLLRHNPTAGDTVVFVDDFAGTGNQAIDFADTLLPELLPGSPRILLVVAVAGRDAMSRIAEKTPMTVVAERVLGPADSLFNQKCRHFDHTEKETLRRYGRMADEKSEAGYGECGFVLVFSHRCPNNSVPILHATKSGFKGLFPR